MSAFDTRVERACSRYLTPGIKPSKLAPMIPVLPMVTGGAGAWLLLTVKILGAVGFMTAANLVILYAS